MILDVIISELTLRKSAYTASMLVALILLTKCFLDISVSIRPELENILLTNAFVLLMCVDVITLALNPDVTILPALISTKLPMSAFMLSAITIWDTIFLILSLSLL